MPVLRVPGRVFLPLLLILSCALGAAQTPAQAAETSPTPPAMTNADVVKMAKAGLSEAVIIAAIQGAGKASFDTDPQTLIALKGEGVGEPVIVALLNRSSATSIAPAASGTGALPAPRDLGDPATPRRGGIYVHAGAVSVRSQALDTQPLAETETRRGMYGKGSTVVVLRPARSSRRVPAAPSFYFYFGPEGTDTGQPGAFVADVTTPSEFILARMKAKSDHRELVLSKTG